MASCHNHNLYFRIFRSLTFAFQIVKYVLNQHILIFVLTAHGKIEMKTHAFIHFHHYIHVVKVLFIHHLKVFHHLSAQSWLFSCIVNLTSHYDSYENILTAGVKKS